jgi:2-iminoacetate synthase ThiH
LKRLRAAALGAVQLDNAPDKDPAAAARDRRCRATEDPYNRHPDRNRRDDQERVDTPLAIRDLHEKYGHIQEVINSRISAPPATLMANWPEPDRADMLRTIAAARLLMPEMNIQAPPNLSDPHYADLADAGINDWGGVSPITPDFINPENPTSSG